MTLQQWVGRKLSESGFANSFVGTHGLLVRRPGRPDVEVYVAEPSSASFDPEDLQAARADLPNCEAVVIVRRPVGVGTVEQATSQGVLVDSFGGVSRALESVGRVAHYQHPDEMYLRRRLGWTQPVERITRVGLKAWRITRVGSLRDLTIITHDRYEFTDDEFRQLLDDYPRLDPDAFVIVNPNASGFSSRVASSAAGLNVVLCTLPDFVGRLDQPWT